MLNKLKSLLGRLRRKESPPPTQAQNPYCGSTLQSISNPSFQSHPMFSEAETNEMAWPPIRLVPRYPSSPSEPSGTPALVPRSKKRAAKPKRKGAEKPKKRRPF